ncbi:zf-TFIIB domain-containing protein [Demequina iriomotensis]|uniref:TFIIB-type zinc ribbon-containing protein n=1 Tax=Demequina iriomotensis TaxID=1536641 RepID=UPI000782CE22|nr:zf-TFIIB domain-containing protein [Demequina iriomotensis]
MKCPVDDATLVMSDRNGVEIDYCPDCRGVWLDRGELDKIIDRTAAAQAPALQARDARDPRDARGYDDRRDQQQRTYDQRSYDQRGYDTRYSKPKRKESFLSDLFDFG